MEDRIGLQTYRAVQKMATLIGAVNTLLDDLASTTYVVSVSIRLGAATGGKPLAKPQISTVTGSPARTL